MNKNQCRKDKNSSRAIGLFILPIGLFMAGIFSIIIPLFGLFFALPVLVLSLGLIAAPQSKVCRILLNRG